MAYKNCSKKSKKKLDRERFRQAVLEAAEAAGKQYGDGGLVSYLEAQAVATPSPFMTLLAKMLSDIEEAPQTKITKIEIVAPLTAKKPSGTEKTQDNESSATKL